jgi:hypothetical protein
MVDWCFFASMTDWQFTGKSWRRLAADLDAEAKLATD